MKAIQETNQIRIGIPRDYNGYINYNTLPNETHYLDGWRDLVEPTYNPETQRKGAIYFDAVNNVFTYPVIEIPIEELKQIAINNAENERLIKIQQEQEKAITNQFQEITDETQSLENQSIYPIWEKFEIGFAFNVNEKYQSFDGIDLKLFKVIQAHAKQSNWNPLAVPALFIRVGLENEILPWVQPLGSQDAYQIGDKVTHLGSTWESTFANNVWEPSVFGWTQI